MFVFTFEASVSVRRTLSAFWWRENWSVSKKKKIDEEGDGVANEGTPPPPASSVFLLSPRKACYSVYARLVIIVCGYCACVLNQCLQKLLYLWIDFHGHEQPEAGVWVQGVQFFLQRY